MRAVGGPGTVSGMTLHEAAAAHLDVLLPGLDEVTLAAITDEVVGRMVEVSSALAEGV